MKKLINKKGIRKGTLGGISFEERLVLSEQNARLVKKEAKFLITISSDNKTSSFKVNSRGRLNVLAIIGPTEKFDKKFKEKLLLEIGLGRAIPYHKSEGWRNKKETKEGLRCNFLPKRQKIFQLTEGQYSLVAPVVFSFLKEVSVLSVEKWKAGSHFWIKAQKFLWNKHTDQIFPVETTSPWPRGVRFSFSRKDELILKDIFWAELNLNKALKNFLSRLAGYLRKRFYQNIKRTNRGKLVDLTDFGNAHESIIKLPLYLKEELADYCFRLRSSNSFVEKLKENIVLPKSKKSIEQCLAQEAEKITHPEKRLQDIQLRVTTGFENLKKDYIVVEVFPFDFPTDFRQTEIEEEVPF